MASCKPLRRAPTRLSQDGAVHIRIEGYRNVQGTFYQSPEVEILPTDLWSGGDVAVGGGSEVDINRTKRTDADRIQISIGFLEEPNDRG